MRYAFQAKINYPTEKHKIKGNITLGCIINILPANFPQTRYQGHLPSTQMTRRLERTEQQPKLQIWLIPYSA